MACDPAARLPRPGEECRWRRLTPADPDWPRLWREIPDPPAVVHVRGEAQNLDNPVLAIVGTRRASARGRAVARGLAAELTVRGWTVASGLALGIDAAAHRGALDAGGTTVAVMATGPDLCYPAAHRGLLAEIHSRGCSLTEYPPGTPPLKHHFPRRNRLLAALARAVLVIEAPRRSGAMLTAHQALDYNREVFAVPGPVDLETSRGCHQLLREGAHLLTAVADVHRVLGHPAGRPDHLSAAGAIEPAPGSAARWIFDRLDLEGVRRDVLRARWPGGEASWQEGLAALELAGLIRRLPGGRLARRIWSG